MKHIEMTCNSLAECYARLRDSDLIYISDLGKKTKVTIDIDTDSPFDGSWLYVPNSTIKEEQKTEELEDSWQSARRAVKTLDKMNLGIKFFGNLFPYLRKRGKLDGCCKLSHRGKTPVWLYDTEGIAKLINEGKLDYKPID